MTHSNLQKLCSPIEYEKFCLYFEILSKWNKVHNLVQKETLPYFFERHILNSLELLPFLSKNQKIADVGSGAGFPGLVLSIMGFENMTLIESIQKKCSFLQNAATKLSVNPQIANKRVETMPLKDQIIVCRGFAPLHKILSLIDSGHFILLKGANFREEINEAQKNWVFDVETRPALYSTDTVILKIDKPRKK
jgi:16S rRNA (guanine527-N7)-methyltransferase